MLTTAETAALLGGWDNILILTHKRPDGDTLGCAAGLCAALRAAGKTAHVLPSLDAVPLLGALLEGYLAPGDFAPDHVVSVDVASVSLFPPNALPWVERGVDLAIDHHPSNEGFAARTCLGADMAACGEIIYEIALDLLGGRPLGADIALPLYVAVSTDTGCFVYSNTTPNTHRVAAALMEAGIDAAGVNKAHFRTKSFTRLKLESMLTDSMELFDGGETAVVSVTLAMLESLGATDADTDNISAFAGQTLGVKNAVTIREYPGEFRISLRTSGGLNATRVCALLGGGGHAAASGCSVKGGTLAGAKAAILEAIRTVRAEG